MWLRVKAHEMHSGTLLSLVPVAKTEPGYIQYDLHQSSERPTEFMFYEIWENEQYLQTHNNTSFMKEFGQRASRWIESVEIDKYDLISDGLRRHKTDLGSPVFW